MLNWCAVSAVISLSYSLFVLYVLINAALQYNPLYEGLSFDEMVAINQLQELVDDRSALDEQYWNECLVQLGMHDVDWIKRQRNETGMYPRAKNNDESKDVNVASTVLSMLLNVDKDREFVTARDDVRTKKRWQHLWRQHMQRRNFGKTGAALEAAEADSLEFETYIDDLDCTVETLGPRRDDLLQRTATLYQTAYELIANSEYLKDYLGVEEEPVLKDGDVFVDSSSVDSVVDSANDIDTELEVKTQDAYATSVESDDRTEGTVHDKKRKPFRNALKKDRKAKEIIEDKKVEDDNINEPDPLVLNTDSDAGAVDVDDNVAPKPPTNAERRAARKREMDARIKLNADKKKADIAAESNTVSRVPSGLKDDGRCVLDSFLSWFVTGLWFIVNWKKDTALSYLRATVDKSDWSMAQEKRWMLIGNLFFFLLLFVKLYVGVSAFGSDYRSVLSQIWYDPNSLHSPPAPGLNDIDKGLTTVQAFLAFEVGQKVLSTYRTIMKVRKYVPKHTKDWIELALDIFDKTFLVHSFYVVCGLQGCHVLALLCFFSSINEAAGALILMLFSSGLALFDTINEKKYPQQFLLLLSQVMGLILSKHFIWILFVPETSLQLLFITHCLRYFYWIVTLISSIFLPRPAIKRD